MQYATSAERDTLFAITSAVSTRLFAGARALAAAAADGGDHLLAHVHRWIGEQRPQRFDEARALLRDQRRHGGQAHVLVGIGEARVQELAAEAPALQAGAQPHSLELAHAGLEHSNRRRADRESRGILYQQQHARDAVVLVLPVRDVVVETVGIERVADVREILGELPGDRDMVLRLRPPDGEAGRHALLRA